MFECRSLFPTPSFQKSHAIIPSYHHTIIPSYHHTIIPFLHTIPPPSNPKTPQHLNHPSFFTLFQVFEFLILCPHPIYLPTTPRCGLYAPGARILLVQSAVPILVSSYSRQRAAIVPGVTVVLSTLAECHYGPLPEANNTMTGGRGKMTPASKISSKDQSNLMPQPKILLHMFSNGGTNTATQLLIVLHERLRAPLPLTGMLYDSCPAKGTYWKDHRAMVYSLPKNVISRAMGNIIIHIILVLLHTEITCGLENPASLLRRTLLDENKVISAADEEPSRSRGDREEGGQEDVAQPPQGRMGGKRSVYLYSKSDQMVDWMDIRDHAANARSLGWDVEEILFDGSAHCGHFQTDELTYVEAMKRMWTGKGYKDGMAGEEHRLSQRGNASKL